MDERGGAAIAAKVDLLALVLDKDGLVDGPALLSLNANATHTIPTGTDSEEQN